MSIVRLEFAIYIWLNIGNDEGTLLRFPTDNPQYDNAVNSFLQPSNELLELIEPILTRFRLLDYTFNTTNGTFNLLATPGHSISPQELVNELLSGVPLYGHPHTEFSIDHTLQMDANIEPRLNNVYVLTESQVDLTRLPLKQSS
jgi:hypothetical protein